MLVGMGVKVGLAVLVRLTVEEGVHVQSVKQTVHIIAHIAQVRALYVAHGPKGAKQSVRTTSSSPFVPGGGGDSVRGFFRRGKFRTGNIPHLSQKIKGKIPHLPNLECIANKGDPGIAIPKRHTIQQSNQQ